MFREYCWMSSAASIRTAAVSGSFPVEIVTMWGSMEISVGQLMGGACEPHTRHVSHLGFGRVSGSNGGMDCST